MSEPEKPGDKKKPRWRREYDHAFTFVQNRIWADERVAGLTRGAPNARDLYFFLVFGTLRTAIPGVSKGGRAAMAEELGWEVEEFNTFFAELERSGLAVADWKAKIVYASGAFKQTENAPAGPGQAVKWRRDLLDLPDCELRSRIDADLRTLMKQKAPGCLRAYMAGRMISADPAARPAANGTSGATADGTTDTTRNGTASAIANGIPGHSTALHSTAQQDPPLPPQGGSAASAARGDAIATSDSPPADPTAGIEGDASEQPDDTPRSRKPRFDFERVYREHYPLQAGKAPGLKHCTRLIKTPEDFARFEAGARAYSALVVAEGREPSKIKYFSSWVNQRGWEDENLVPYMQPAVTVPAAHPGAVTSSPVAVPLVMPNGAPWPAEIARLLAPRPPDEQQKLLAKLRAGEPFRFDGDGSMRF